MAAYATLAEPQPLFLRAEAPQSLKNNFLYLVALLSYICRPQNYTVHGKTSLLLFSKNLIILIKLGISVKKILLLHKVGVFCMMQSYKFQSGGKGFKKYIYKQTFCK